MGLLVKVLITGHAGFIGRHFHRRLADHDVVGVDIVHGDDARDFFRRDDTRFDLVVHCAAVVGGRLKIEGAPLDLAVDLAIDAELYGWALRTRPGRIVYFSSSAAYPVDLQESPSVLAERCIDLDRLGRPDLTYGWAKLTGEMLARHAGDLGLAVHVFRPFSGYGEDQALDYPFPSFVARAARRDDPFEVWGDGGQVRDFIHVDDIVDAVLTAVDLDVRDPVNLGWGRPTSFTELAGMCMATAGYQGAIRTDPTKPVGVRYRVADPTRLRGFYAPRITLEEGIERALRRLR